MFVKAFLLSMWSLLQDYKLLSNIIFIYFNIISMLLKCRFKAILARLLYQATYIPLYCLTTLKTQEWGVKRYSFNVFYMFYLGNKKATQKDSLV